MGILILLARRFVAGENLEDAIFAARKLNKEDISVTIDFLGEHTKSKKEALENLQNYIKLIKTLRILKLNSNVSIKLTSLGIDINKKFCYSNLNKLIKLSKKYNMPLTIDMESSIYTSTTLKFYKKLHKKYKSLEIALQANLKRSKKDIDILIKTKSNIRLVKGAYKENPKIAYKNKEDVNKSYTELLKKLVKSKCFISIATHDENIINFSKSLINKYKIKKNKYEFQMLYGIRRDIQKKLADQNYPIRVYVPYGKKWLPYFYRRLRERKENILFIVKNLMRG